MKKCVIKAICLMMCSLMIIGSAAIVSATGVPSDDGVSPATDIIRPIAYDLYYPTPFSSLAAAKSYFSSSYTYIQCYQYYGGDIYNWYFVYSDYSRQYLRVVKYSDDDTVLSIQPSPITN